MRGRLLLAGGLLLSGAHLAAAQGAPRVTPGWGVDTAAAAWSEIGWHGDVPAIYRAWRAFGRQGVPGVKSLLDSGARDEDLRRTVEGLLAMPWPRVAAEWRRRIEAFGSAAEAPLEGGPLP